MPNYNFYPNIKDINNSTRIELLNILERDNKDLKFRQFDVKRGLEILSWFQQRLTSLKEVIE